MKKTAEHLEARNLSPSQIWVCPACHTTFNYGAEWEGFIPREEVIDESQRHVTLLRHRLCGSPLVMYNRA